MSGTKCKTPIHVIPKRALLNDTSLELLNQLVLDKGSGEHVWFGGCQITGRDELPEFRISKTLLYYYVFNVIMYESKRWVDSNNLTQQLKVADMNVLQIIVDAVSRMVEYKSWMRLLENYN